MSPSNTLRQEQGFYSSEAQVSQFITDLLRNHKHVVSLKGISVMLSLSKHELVEA